MEERSNSVEEQEQVPTLGSGAMLAAERKKQKKTIEEIADELNLSLSQIRTIELDQSEGLPEPTYVRGYIRAYANLLGLNAEQVLSHYLNKNWQKSANLDDMPRGLSDADTSEPSTFSPARVIAFLVLSGLVAFFWYSGAFDGFLGKQTGLGDNGSSNSELVVTESNTEGVVAETVDTEIEPDIDEQGITSDVAESSLNLQADLVAGDEAASSADLNSDEAIDTNETRVELSFTETSWVDIRDEQQNRLAYQSYPAGQTLDVSAQGALVVLIGNAKGVQMTLNGQPYDLGQHTEGVYAKFTVGTPAQ